MWSMTLQAAPNALWKKGCVAYYFRHVAAVVGVRAVLFRQLVKAFCIGLLHRRAVQLEVVSP